MATQIKPKTSGSFTTITTTSTGLASDSSTGMPSAAAGTGVVHNALRACNEWHNAGGAGTHATRAAKLASAAGISIQEV
jgi:hypothetical protein